MLEILPGPDHMLALRLSGTLTADDYDRIADELSAKLKRHERLGVYTETHDLAGMKPAALAKDLRLAFALLGDFQRFPRAALVTQEKWLRTLANTGKVFFPRTDIRQFEPRDKERALAWVAEVPDEPRTPALRIIPTTRRDTFAFVWNGRISVEDAAEFARALKPVIESQEKIRLLGRIERLGGVVAGAITEGHLLSLKRALLRKVERYAVVGGPPWLKRYVGFMRSWTKIDLRHFDVAAESEAWAWLEANPVQKDQPSEAFAVHLNG